jgi:2-methylisocitrate lyase-like PEP mutase family enzyme
MTLLRTTLPDRRRPLLRQWLTEPRLLRALECHNPLSAMLASAARTNRTGAPAQFDLLWASGFSHATALGLPDAELSLLERRLDSISDITAVTDKPIIADADTGGGDAMALGLLCRRLEALGVSAVIVEDKTGAKRTSLAANVDHELEDPERFVEKLELARSYLQSEDFLIFARIESLIAGRDVAEAIRRASYYLRSRADGIVIHSKDASGREVLEFMSAFRRLSRDLGIEKPLICIPTAYHHLTGAQLHEAGARIVIHGNHLVRAAFRGMQRAASLILEHDRSLEADEVCATVDELLATVGTGS